LLRKKKNRPPEKRGQADKKRREGKRGAKGKKKETGPTRYPGLGTKGFAEKKKKKRTAGGIVPKNRSGKGSEGDFTGRNRREAYVRENTKDTIKQDRRSFGGKVIVAISKRKGFLGEREQKGGKEKRR